MDFIHCNKAIFQSTSSIQRKTKISYTITSILTNFNPLPLYRGRPRVRSASCRPALFQSTSSIQRKTARPGYFSHSTIFQSTSSIQRKTGVKTMTEQLKKDFNPLPLYRGRPCPFINRTHLSHFNPLPLYRGRHELSPQLVSATIFQSTSSIQRKTLTA